MDAVAHAEALRKKQQNRRFYFALAGCAIYWATEIDADTAVAFVKNSSSTLYENLTTDPAGLLERVWNHLYESRMVIIVGLYVASRLMATFFRKRVEADERAEQAAAAAAAAAAAPAAAAAKAGSKGGSGGSKKKK